MGSPLEISANSNIYTIFLDVKDEFEEAFL